MLTSFGQKISEDKFKDAISLLPEIQIPPYHAPIYASILAKLQERLALIQSENAENIDSITHYNEAIDTHYLVDLLHREFHQKMESFVKNYLRIKKIPWTHAILNQQGYKDYVFHAEEYKGHSPQFKNQVKSIGDQLLVFVTQFLATYQNINELDARSLDLIVCDNDANCFDAQVEGRYLPFLILKLLDLSQDEGTDHEAIPQLLAEIKPLSKKMVLTANEVIEKVRQFSQKLQIDPTSIERLETILKADPYFRSSFALR